MRHIEKKIFAMFLSAMFLTCSITHANNTLSRLPCHWCVTNPFDTAIRDTLSLAPKDTLQTTSSSRAVVGALSYATFIGVIPLFFWRSNHDGKNHWPSIPESLSLGQVIFTTMLLTELTKISVSRARPYTTRSDYVFSDDADDAKSFFSGHSSLAFASATTIGFLASYRHDPNAGWIWFSGMSLATTTGILRIVADKHWASDVIVGAVVGSSLGIAIPWWMMTQFDSTKHLQDTSE